MNKKELSQLRYLNREIELLKEQIEKAEQDVEANMAADTVAGSNPVWPYQPRSFRVEGIAIPEYERRVERLKKKLRRRLEELLEKREELEEFIDKIDDSELRMIFTLRYINGLSWQQIAARMGVEGDGSTQRKKHDRFLKSFPKFPKKA